MAKELNLEDRVSAYLRDELTQQDRSNFESDLKTDSLLADELAFQQSLNTAIESTRSEELKKSFIAIETSLETPKKQEVQKTQKAKTATNKILLWGIVLFLIAAGLAFYLLSSAGKSIDENRMYADNYAAFPNTMIEIERGENTNPSNELAEIMQHYDKGQYKDALQSITNYKGEKEQELKFYQAISLMELGKHEKAIKIFETLEKNNLPNFQSAIYWYSALAYLKLENHPKTIIQLEKLIVSPDGYQKTKARGMLERLR